MALKQTKTTTASLHGSVNGVLIALDETREIPVNFYIKVERIYGDKHSVVVQYSVSQNVGDPVRVEQSAQFTPDLEGPNFIRQAYEHLKTLPEFADAEDC